MGGVRIASVAVAHPPHVLTQAFAATGIARLSGDERRVAAIARGTRINTRRTALPPVALAELGTIQARNDVYHRIAPGLALEAAATALPPGLRESIGLVATSSCTGYTVPGWGTDLVESLGLSPATARLPITESGCAGGLVALARAADFVASHGESALGVAVELCSLSFHPGGGDGNLTASLIFGDGAGAARLEPGEGPGLEILGASSFLIPSSRDALGFDLTDHGFYPVLGRDLADSLPAATAQAADALLTRHGVKREDVSAWLLHPGGARILRQLETALGIAPTASRWSWQSMAEFGNTSSAAVFDVLRRYLDDPGRPGGHAVVAAFGPGVSIELMLVRGC